MSTIRLQVRRKQKREWEQLNIVLLDGELGQESDTGKVKIGFGLKPWNDLPYINQTIEKKDIQGLLTIHDIVPLQSGDHGFLDCSGQWKEVSIGDIDDLANQIAEKAELNHIHRIPPWKISDIEVYGQHGDRILFNLPLSKLFLEHSPKNGYYIELFLTSNVQHVEIITEKHTIKQTTSHVVSSHLILNQPGRYIIIFIDFTWFIDNWFIDN